ncbi:Cephalosporin-C deacetylase [Verrucomicrobium sp. GAS474]|uniref:acetylxylan esterase n=1 Tax=Verrucomicrobium sp. GAS474 TaxID=1882831 RepID=UPI00087AABAE|nr:acetylxylan esterase [Verrucomicrobium sp. GAS474]SDU08692.1 Cephalosporin-C deacetylase [Verrucomicrobium sp. GAS474]
MRFRFTPLAALALALLSAFSARADEAKVKITLVPDKATGIYELNEKVTWTVDVVGDRAGLTALPYAVKQDAATVVGSGTLDLTAGPATISGTRAEAGALLVEVMSMDKGKLLPIAMGGAVFAPEKLAAALPAPADFDAFWQEKLRELAEVPPNPKLEPMSLEGVKGAEGMEAFKLTTDNIRGTHMEALLAKPAKEQKYPALLIFNSAGVSALDKGSVLAYAKPGWIVLNVNAHDLPIDEAPEFYKKMKETELKDYLSIGNESRESCYFLRMFLGCVRGIDYVASMPEWDGKTLIITGVSQGGMQSFAAAALSPKVTAMVIDVPSGCDVYGPLATPPRAAGWPPWISKYNPQGKDLAKIKETAGYFDGIYFAERIHCPTIIGVALLDIAARPSGAIAAFNAIPAPTPKQLIVMPLADHYGTGGTQGDFFYTFAHLREAIQKGAAWSLPYH